MVAHTKNYLRSLGKMKIKKSPSLMFLFRISAYVYPADEKKFTAANITKICYQTIQSGSRLSIQQNGRVFPLKFMLRP